MLVAMCGERGATRYLLLRAGGAHCLLPAAQVRLVVPRVPARPIPGSAPEVVGVGEVEGGPVAILELARLLGEEPDPRPERPVTVVLRPAVAEGLALDADEAVRMVSLPEEALTPGGKGLAVAVAMVDGKAALVLDAVRLGPGEAG